MTETIHQLEVLRYDPETDTAPHFQTYEVSCQEDWVVLDAINYVKENLDRTLSYRWSCHMAVCGSCGMVVNGEPVLSCHAFVRDYPEKIRVEPLGNFPIERDLVVAIDDPRIGPVTAADIHIVERVHTGARSRGFRGPVLSEQEACIGNMYRHLNQYLSRE